MLQPIEIATLSDRHFWREDDDKARPASISRRTASAAVDQQRVHIAGADRGADAVAPRRFAPGQHSGWLFFLFCRPGCDARRDATRSPNPRNPARQFAEDRDTRILK